MIGVEIGKSCFHINFHGVDIRGYSQRTFEARVGGGYRNPDKLGHREGGSYSATRTSEFKKNKDKKHICFCGIKRLTVK